MAGWDIPDFDEAGTPIQSHIFNMDVAVLRLGYEGYRVFTGCAVTPQGSPDMTVHVAAGTILPGTAELIAVTAGDLTVTAADATLLRMDLISSSSAGVKTITAGTADTIAAVKPPDIPAGHVPLAVVTVLPSTTSIDATLIVDKRFLFTALPASVVAHGSMGATETFDYAAGPSHEGTVNASLTVTLAGAVAGECILTLGLTNDGTPGHTLTLPGSVVNAAAIEAAFDTSAGAYNLIVLRTPDSGTNWYGLRVGPGATGPAGADGISGGAISIPYVFSTTTTDADPGNGNLRLSNATQTSATVIRADLLASDTTDWSAVLATLADSTNTVKGHIRLYLTADPTKWLVFTVSAVASPAGYKNITVANVAGSSASPFANADPITLSFTRAGDVGASGTASVGTDPIWDAAGDLAVGTGADTAGRLPLGAAGGVVSSLNGAIAYNSGTSFPSAVTGDRYWRTDLGLECYYDGTRWLTVTKYYEPFQPEGPVMPISATGVPLRFTWDGSVADLWLISIDEMTYHSSPTGTNFWDIQAIKGTAAESEANVGSDVVTSSDTSNNWTPHSVTVGALLGSTYRYIRLLATKHASGTAIYVKARLVYRIVVT